MSEILAVLDKVQSLVVTTDDNGNLDLAVALMRLGKAVEAVKAELEAEFDAHVEQQAAFWLLRQDAAADGVSAHFGAD